MDNNWIKKKKLITSRHSNMVQSSNSAEDNTEVAAAKEAEKQIQSFIILQAWRRQRERNNKLQEDVKNLSTQVENLQLQNFALRQLLDAEKTRVSQANSDLKKILNALEECNFEKKALVNEKEQFENRLHQVEEQMTAIENECKNKNNELMTAKLEAQTWEKQLEKEREKLSRMKSEKKLLMDEVRFKGNLMVWKIRSFEQFSRLYNFLQVKPNNPALPWDDTFGRNDPVSEMSRSVRIPKRQQITIIVEKPPESPELKALLAKMGKKVTEEDGRIEELEKSTLGKTWVLLKNY